MGINRPIFLTNPKKFQDIANLELLEVLPVSFSVYLASFDYLIFTSHNSVKFFAKQYPDWTTKPSLAISKQTAKTIENLGGNVFYCGTSTNGDEFALEIANLLINKKVLYVRAKESASDLEAILSTKNIQCASVIAYETKCICPHNAMVFPKKSIFIFTSPKNVLCFFENFYWDESFIAICIGKTTQKALPKNLLNYVSQTPSIESCITLAKSL